MAKSIPEIFLLVFFLLFGFHSKITDFAKYFPDGSWLTVTDFSFHFSDIGR